MSYTNKVVPILKEAGRELAAGFGKAKVERQKSGRAVDVVTKLDESTEKFIYQQLKKLYPEIGFWGEEFGGNKKQKKFWLLDPIDGTAHFVRGVPFCTTMLALVENGQVVFSAINDFLRDDFYSAEKGSGAKKNGRPIHVSKRALKDAYFSHEINLGIRKNLDLFAKLREKPMMFNTISCGFEFPLVATGKIEGRIMIDAFGGDHDYAAGSLLVKEAGGVVVNIGKNSYDYKNHSFLAVNRVVFKELRRLYKL